MRNEIGFIAIGQAAGNIGLLLEENHTVSIVSILMTVLFL